MEAAAAAPAHGQAPRGISVHGVHCVPTAWKPGVPITPANIACPQCVSALVAAVTVVPCLALFPQQRHTQAHEQLDFNLIALRFSVQRGSSCIIQLISSLLLQCTLLACSDNVSMAASGFFG